MKQLLQNIKTVEYIETKYLLNATMVHNDNILLNYWRNFAELYIDGLAKVEVDEAVDNGSRLSTVKLTAHTACNFIVDHRKLAWRVTTVTGEKYLIGTTEQPYPITTVSSDFPDKETERSGQTITVTWKTPLTLLKIID